MIGPIVNPVWQEWAAVALAEGRLSWRVTDAQGRPCNGGRADPIPLGEWSPAIEDAELCRRGWHTTSDPVRWRGARVWLVEGEGPAGTENDKSAWRRIRPLAEVDPHRSICQRISVAAMRPHLAEAVLGGADLRWANLTGANLTGANLAEAVLGGANLTGANLTGANLTRANLTRANLRWANLTGANLREAVLGGADLRWANLTGANLTGANLTRANLREAVLGGADLTRAYLTRANLRWANLTGANLREADLTEADLTRAYLTGADLAGAVLGGWERGPDGIAREVTP